ncbi:MATE family efflux transporter [Aestuariivita sp.]|uniref:MATE family efflux transporter n=1 Tax=Aestuariivita sp. TaxID=1872407 RepID=UPI00217055BB|nr:MATE family efflux transporter [Aestuariivita sp.]MCE8008428.1 MATE family efflux transporter [Aestuariivita sp.]
MTYTAHMRAVLMLGLPLVGGHLAQFAIGLTDTVMLGWYGVEALAAVTLAGTYFFVLFLMGSGFAWAVMPMVAAFEAEGDQTNLRRATRMGLWLSVLFAAVTIPLLWWSEPILLMLGQQTSVASDAAEYLRIAGWGIFPALVMMVLKSYLAALAKTQAVLWMTVLAAIVNGIFNYALIFGNWGAPELGLGGAAIASVITQIVAMGGMMIYAVLVLPQHALFQRLWRPDWEMFRKVFWLGLPIGLTLLSEVSLFAASALMMGWLGTIELAAHGVAVQLASATFMLHLGLANAATIRASQAYALRDRLHMSRGALSVIGLSLVAALLTVTVFLSLPEPLISVFVEPDDPARAEIIAIGVGLLAMAALFQLVDGAQVIALGLLRGMQDTGKPMVIAALSYWVVGIPASYILGFPMGLEGIGIWLGLVLGLACAGVLLMIRFWGTSISTLDAGQLA